MTAESLMKTPEIPSVDWWITSRCNLRCDFCYGPVPAVDPSSLRDRIAEAISDSPTQAVTFCGGEPLLVKRLPEYARRQRESGKRTVLNTNGELLSRRFPSVADLPFDIVGVSLDGPDAAVHRSMRGADANFARTLAAARGLAANSDLVKLKIATVLSNINIGHMPRLSRLVREISPALWRIYQYSHWGPQNFGAHRHIVADDAFDTAVQRAKAAVKPVPVHSSTTSTTGGCLIIDPYGNVIRQEGAGYTPIGNCLEESLSEIWQRSPTRDTVSRNKHWISTI